MCAAGYRNSDDGLLCAACAEGFRGYPNCKREESEEFKEREEGEGAAGACSLPALPRTLNGRGMLEDGAPAAQAPLHLQGDYWLDLRSRAHVMHVTISQPSILKLRVDMGALAGAMGVAVTLEQLTSAHRAPELHQDAEAAQSGGNRRRLIWRQLKSVEDGGRMASGEGFVEAVLEGGASTGPNPSSSPDASSKRYRIILAYQVLGELRGGKEEELCRALGLQLSITPRDALKTLSAQVDARCPSDVVGRIDIPEHVDVSATGWSRNGSFYIKAAEAGTRVMRRGTAVQPITLRIPEVPGKIARLSASVGYRFEMSSFGLLVEAERADASADMGEHRPLCEATPKPVALDGQGDGKAGGGAAEAKDKAAQGSKDEWNAWRHIGREDAGRRPRPAKAYYEDGSSGGQEADEADDDDDDDVDDDETERGWNVGADRDGEYDFHDLVKSALSSSPWKRLSGLVHGGDDSEHITDHDAGAAFPGMRGGLPGGVHVIHFPFSHGLLGRGANSDARPGVEDTHIPSALSKFFGQHPFSGFFDTDDDDEDDGDDGDDGGIWDDNDGDDDGQDDFGNRRRRALLSADDEGDGASANSVLVDRDEKEDEQPAPVKIKIETMLRAPAAGSDDMFACRSGRDTYNQNVLDEWLPAGTYTLWLVRDSELDDVIGSREGAEAANDVSMRCLPVDLAISVSFDDPPPTPVTCEARTLPAALHEPGFLGPTGTRIHLQDTFYMREARLSRRHFIDFTVRGQGSSLLRVHVESLESVDIRLSVLRYDRSPGNGKSRLAMVDVQNPHVVGGLRGDAILSLLQPGSYKLQMEFLNPGGAPGMPKWDLGEMANGQGRQGGGRLGCEVLDLEFALMPLEDVGDGSGWRQECPGRGDGAGKIPSLSDVAGGKPAMLIGDSFNLPAPDGGAAPGESMLQRLRQGEEPVFWANTRNGSRGYVIASYPLYVEQIATLRAGLHSDFVHDDLVLDVVDSAGRLVFTGAHRRSYNHIQSLIQPGRYRLKIRQSMSAGEVLASKTAGQWIKKTDSQGKPYFYNTVSKTSQWHRPAAMAGSDCARFSFWVALEPFDAADDCHVASDAMHVPPTLDVPGMLASHARAYVQGVFSIGGQQGLTPTGQGNSMYQSIRLTVARPSVIRAIVVPLPDAAGNSVLTELTLHSVAPLTEQEEKQGQAMEVEQVARGEFLSPASYHTEQRAGQEFSALGTKEGPSAGSRQVLSAEISPADEHQSAEGRAATAAPRSFLLQLRHMLPPVQAFKCTKFSLLVSVAPVVSSEETEASTEGDDGTRCTGVSESKWPQISEDLTELFACQGVGADADFRCWHDLHGMRVVQKARPVRHQFAINLATESHLRIEMGFPLYAVPLMTSLERLACPHGAGPCASEGAQGGDEIAPLVSADRPGASLLVVRWLPRGRYIITIAQEALAVGANSQDEPEQQAGAGVQAVGGGGKTKSECERFSFRLMLEKVATAGVSETHMRHHVQALPASLNGVALLKFGGAAHLWGRFAMPRPGLQRKPCHTALLRSHVTRPCSLLLALPLALSSTCFSARLSAAGRCWCFAAPASACWCSWLAPCRA